MSYVFIHGLGQLPSSWDKVISQLPEGIEAYSPNLCDLIDGQETTYENLYRAFENKCNFMKQPLCLCGISLGAVLALQYALNNPQYVQSLIMIAPQYKMPKLLLTVQNFVFHIMPEKAFREMGFAKKDIILLTRSMRKINFVSYLKAMECPSLIICGQNDTPNKKAARELAAYIPGAELALIENVGHEVNTESPMEFANLIKKFWFDE